MKKIKPRVKATRDGKFIAESIIPRVRNKSGEATEIKQVTKDTKEIKEINVEGLEGRRRQRVINAHLLLSGWKLVKEAEQELGTERELEAESF
ncbi:MAG: hypothetical protein K0U98_25990 [Deltaproteobacteria bacterium]|nr:hypothetical protein [Deltaproteobacteria bacterium]